MKDVAERPWQPWERNYSGGRVGVQEQQGSDENWMVIHIESGGAKTTTSLRLHEAWDFALMVSPQLKAELGRRHDEMRKNRDALYALTHRQTETDLLRQVADEHSCGDGCEYAFGGFGLGGCHQTDRDGCKFAEADNLRQLADAIDTANASTEADVLRAIDSCGGAPAPDESADWSRGYNAALDAATREVKRLFARAGGPA